MMAARMTPEEDNDTKVADESIPINAPDPFLFAQSSHDSNDSQTLFAHATLSHSMFLPTQPTPSI
jgi:hypothetical protein